MRFSCLMVILSGLTYVGACFADMPDPGPQKHDVEIQGAKIISEGGYLWFHVINHDYRELYVVIHFPSDVVVIGRVPTVVNLRTNESADFYFQVLYYWTGSPIFTQQGSTKELRFYFEIYTLYHTSKSTTENVEFDVKAVPLNDRVDNRPLFYFAMFTLAAVAITVIVIVAGLGKRKNGKAILNDKLARATAF